MLDVCLTCQVWSWDRKCEEAFNICKEALSSNTVLTHYDVSKPLIFACDASPYGVGAVISYLYSVVLFLMVFNKIRSSYTTYIFYRRNMIGVLFNP